MSRCVAGADALRVRRVLCHRIGPPRPCGGCWCPPRRRRELARCHRRRLFVLAASYSSPSRLKVLRHTKSSVAECPSVASSLRRYHDFPASARISRTSAATSRRRAIASALYRPCFHARRLPFGTPGFCPPCIRQRPFGIAGDRHGLPLRVRAPHRGLRCIGNLLCIRLILQFREIPTPRALDDAHHRLPPGMDVGCWSSSGL